MKKEIRTVTKDGIVQVTIADERWYIKDPIDPVSGLPIKTFLTAGGGASHLLPGKTAGGNYVNREGEMDLLPRAEMGRIPAGARAPRG